MNRIRNILEKLVSIGDKRKNKFLKNFWEVFLIDDNFVTKTLGNGVLSRLYNNLSNKSIFTEEEHKLIPRLILEIKYLDSN